MPSIDDVAFSHVQEPAFMPTPDIDSSELLFRQIGPRGNPIYFDPARSAAVHHSLFIPVSNDTDGLSLVRSRFRTRVWSAYRLEQPAVRFRLAVLDAMKLQELASNYGFLSLTYASTADGLDGNHGEPLAHCVVVQINRIDYDNDSDAKKRIKEWAMGVSMALTAQDVIGPFQQPTELDPYRPVDLNDSGDRG